MVTREDTAPDSSLRLLRFRKSAKIAPPSFREAYDKMELDNPDYEGPFNCIVTDHGISYTVITSNLSSELGIEVGDIIIIPIDTTKIHACGVALMGSILPTPAPKEGERPFVNTNDSIWNSINIYAGPSLQIVKIEKKLIWSDGNPYANNRTGFPCICITSLKSSKWFNEDVIESITTASTSDSQETVFVTQQLKYKKQKVIVVKSPIKDKHAFLSALNAQENSLIEGAEFVVVTGNCLIANYSVATYKPVR